MIIRSEKKSNYTILPNEFLLDETISDKARGVLVRLLSRPDNWNLNINHLVKTGKGGHTAVRSAIRELENAGYIQKEITRHENGRIIGTEYIIHESPVKSCQDIPAPEQLDQTQPREVQGELFDESTLPDPKPEVIAQGEPDPKPGGQDAQPQDTHIEAISVEDNRMRETVIKETNPIIKTDIKQTLRETTTTPAREAEPDPGIFLPAPPSSSPTNEIINLIPIHHQTPVVLSLVNKAVMEYPEFEVKEAVAYAGANVRGGSMQFKAYLDKTLKNKWGKGFLDAMDNSNPFGQNLFGAGQIPNGFTTGSKRLDGNLAACLEFAAYCENRKEATA